MLCEAIVYDNVISNSIEETLNDESNRPHV